jgi:hypothetical protein
MLNSKFHSKKQNKPHPRPFFFETRVLFKQATPNAPSLSNQTESEIKNRIKSSDIQDESTLKQTIENAYDQENPTKDPKIRNQEIDQTYQELLSELYDKKLEDQLKNSTETDLEDLSSFQVFLLKEINDRNFKEFDPNKRAQLVQKAQAQYDKLRKTRKDQLSKEYETEAHKIQDPEIAKALIDSFKSQNSLIKSRKYIDDPQTGIKAKAQKWNQTFTEIQQLEETLTKDPSKKDEFEQLKKKYSENKKNYGNQNFIPPDQYLKELKSIEVKTETVELKKVLDIIQSDKNIVGAIELLAILQNSIYPNLTKKEFTAFYKKNKESIQALLHANQKEETDNPKKLTEAINNIAWQNCESIEFFTKALKQQGALKEKLINQTVIDSLKTDLSLKQKEFQDKFIAEYQNIIAQIPDPEIKKSMLAAFQKETSLVQMRHWIDNPKEGVKAKVALYAPYFSKISTLEKDLNEKFQNSPEFQQKLKETSDNYQTKAKSYDSDFISPRKYFESLEQLSKDFEKSEIERATLDKEAQITLFKSELQEDKIAFTNFLDQANFEKYIAEKFPKINENLGEFFLEGQEFFQQKFTTQYQEQLKNLPDKDIAQAMFESFSKAKDLQEMHDYLNGEHGVKFLVETYTPALKGASDLEKDLAKNLQDNPDLLKKFLETKANYQNAKKVFEKGFISPNSYLKDLQEIQEAAFKDEKSLNEQIFKNEEEFKEKFKNQTQNQFQFQQLQSQFDKGRGKLTRREYLSSLQKLMTQAKQTSETDQKNLQKLQQFSVEKIPLNIQNSKQLEDFSKNKLGIEFADKTVLEGFLRENYNKREQLINQKVEQIKKFQADKLPKNAGELPREALKNLMAKEMNLDENDILNDKIGLEFYRALQGQSVRFNLQKQEQTKQNADFKKDLDKFAQEKRKKNPKISAQEISQDFLKSFPDKAKQVQENENLQKTLKDFEKELNDNTQQESKEKADKKNLASANKTKLENGKEQPEKQNKVDQMSEILKKRFNFDLKNLKNRFKPQQIEDGLNRFAVLQADSRLSLKMLNKTRHPSIATFMIASLGVMKPQEFIDLKKKMLLQDWRSFNENMLPKYLSQIANHGNFTENKERLRQTGEKLNDYLKLKNKTDLKSTFFEQQKQMLIDKNTNESTPIDDFEAQFKEESLDQNPDDNLQAANLEQEIDLAEHDLPNTKLEIDETKLNPEQIIDNETQEMQFDGEQISETDESSNTAQTLTDQEQNLDEDDQINEETMNDGENLEDENLGKEPKEKETSEISETAENELELENLEQSELPDQTNLDLEIQEGEFAEEFGMKNFQENADLQTDEALDSDEIKKDESEETDKKTDEDQENIDEIEEFFEDGEDMEIAEDENETDMEETPKDIDQNQEIKSKEKETNTENKSIENSNEQLEKAEAQEIKEQQEQAEISEAIKTKEQTEKTEQQKAQIELKERQAARIEELETQAQAKKQLQLALLLREENTAKLSEKSPEFAAFLFRSICEDPSQKAQESLTNSQKISALDWFEKLKEKTQVDLPQARIFFEKPTIDFAVNAFEAQIMSFEILKLLEKHQSKEVTISLKVGFVQVDINEKNSSFSRNFHFVL